MNSRKLAKLRRKIALLKRFRRWCNNKINDCKNEIVLLEIK